MKRVAMMAVAAATLSCAAVDLARSAATGDGAGAADALDRGFQQGKAYYDQSNKCEALRNDTVSYQEERSMGGAIAVAAAVHMGGLMIAPTPDTSEQKLADPKSLHVDEKAQLNQMTREVARIGAALGARSSRPEIFWTFAVLNDDHVNAFSAPGGYVFVSRGLLKTVKSENALAGVLGHEISHVTDKDTIKAYLESKVWACKEAAAISVGTGEVKEAAERLVSSLNIVPDQLVHAVSGALSTAGHAVNFDDQANRALLKLIASNLNERLAAGYAKEQEFAADKGAVELTMNAGYDPADFIDVVRALPNSASPYLSHHPDSTERATAMEKQVEALTSSAAEDPMIDVAGLRKAVALKPEITRVVSGEVASNSAE